MTMISERYAALVRSLRSAVLDVAAVTPRELRRAIEARAAQASGRTEPAPADVPADVVHYVDTVTRSAYRITEDDVHALRRAGYSDDAIFELTVSAAVGAGLGRLERGYAALKGER